MIIGIDIGTSNSSICFLNSENKAEPINISTGMSMYGSNFSLPSAVYVEEDGSVLVGQAALNSRLRKPQCFRAEFKRNLGECIPIVLGGRSFFPEELYTELFRHMLSCAQKLGQGTVEKAYITYPASYGKERQDRITTAAKAAGLFDISLVDEPTSASMHYLQLGLLKDGQTILVYDFGGGTFDVSLMRLKDGIFESLAEPMGLEHCGGIDIDRAIFADILSRVDGETLRSLQSNPVHRQRLESQIAELAVKAKHHLTASEVFQDYVNVGFDLVEYALTREKLDGMIAGLVQKTIDCCRRILAEANLSVEKLDGILLVGGTSRIPLVTQLVGRFAGKVPVISSVDLELAVVRGAVYRQVNELKEEESSSTTTIEKSASNRELSNKIEENLIEQDPLYDVNRQGCVVYLDGWVYFLDSDHGISRRMIDGDLSTKLALGNYFQLYAQGRHIYAIISKSIIRISVDNGTKEIVVCDKDISYNDKYRVVGNTLYFTVGNGRFFSTKKHLCAYDMVKKNKKYVVLNEDISQLAVAGDKLLFMNRSSPNFGIKMIDENESIMTLADGDIGYFRHFHIINNQRGSNYLYLVEHYDSSLRERFVIYDNAFNEVGTVRPDRRIDSRNYIVDRNCMYLLESGSRRLISAIDIGDGKVRKLMESYDQFDDLTVIGDSLYAKSLTSNKLFVLNVASGKEGCFYCLF